ncbi:hypothetical protein LIER_13212 [Lithospermum erythrorhizon]|uniref:Uncharacterized protein n=1 Tax=Lithospermum erythrorhizon TaxID=34254 RepID=A0AAV3PW60_LITER
MSFSIGRRSAMFSALVLLLIISLLHVWGGKVGAIRLFQENIGPSRKLGQATKSSMNQTELFYKYFSGKLSDLKNSTSSRNGTFEDSKRRVPSCPDPLHN